MKLKNSRFSLLFLLAMIGLSSCNFEIFDDDETNYEPYQGCYQMAESFLLEIAEDVNLELTNLSLTFNSLSYEEFLRREGINVYLDYADRLSLRFKHKAGAHVYYLEALPQLEFNGIKDLDVYFINETTRSNEFDRKTINAYIYFHHEIINGYLEINFIRYENDPLDHINLSEEIIYNLCYQNKIYSGKQELTSPIVLNLMK